MAYTKTIWENSPSENTPLSAENLNNIENGIDDVDTRLTTAESDINNVDTRLTTAEGEIDTAQTDINNAEAVIGNETDTYSASSTYALGSLVIYNSLLYKCTTAITVAEAWNGAKWTQVSLTSLANDGDVYSTSEQIVGKWIDGKPLYRKVVEYDDITKESSKDISYIGIDNLINMNFNAYTGQSNNTINQYSSHYTTETDNCRIFFRNNKIEFRFGSIIMIQKVILILEYTKTTD